jgi:uncharacterized protein (DUF427 family)
LFNGKYTFDTIKAFHVWEHPNFPQYYVPISSFTSDANLAKMESVEGTNGAAFLGRLSVGKRSTERVLIFNTKALKDLVKIDFRAIDQWFEEDVPIFCHPKDPYKRIDILQSTRKVKVGIDGVTLWKRLCVHDITCLRRVSSGSTCRRAIQRRCVPTRARQITTMSV